MTDSTAVNCVTIIDPFWPQPWPDVVPCPYPQPVPVAPQPQTFTTTSAWLTMPQRLADEDVERIAQRVAELLKPKRRKRKARR